MVLVFQKICFKVIVLKMIKVTSDCYIKTYRSLKWATVLKITLVPIFRGTYVLSFGFKVARVVDLKLVFTD